jgi:hypothetical protein
MGGMGMRRVAVLTALLAFVVAACSGNGGEATQAAATPSEQQARSVAENMLRAYNSGDYAALTRDWSSAMKFAVSDDRFRDFRDEALPVTGQFVRLISITPTRGDGDADVSYDVAAEFESREAVLFTVTLSSDGKVEGVDIRPQS